MEFLIVTGMSGAGKSTVVNALEDIGYFCVDNIPPKLLAPICTLSESSEMNKLAVVTDIRGGNLFVGLVETLNELKRSGNEYKVLFIDAKDEILIRRHKETRRKHPLIDNFSGDLNAAVSFERDVMTGIKHIADFTIDTSSLSALQLRQRIFSMFSEEEGCASLNITCMSFGYKHGIPQEADLVFDVRCLPNPYYINELREKTGLDKDVADYVFSNEMAQETVRRFEELLMYMLPNYVQEGKSQLVVAIGCTGGKHRSVALCEHVAKEVKKKYSKVNVIHRDMRK